MFATTTLFAPFTHCIPVWRSSLRPVPHLTRRSIYIPRSKVAMSNASARRTLPECWGHRGASAAFPENTLASFERAIRDGSEAIESGKVSDGEASLQP